jgi:hypothetical protein
MHDLEPDDLGGDSREQHTEGCPLYIVVLQGSV